VSSGGGRAPQLQERRSCVRVQTASKPW